MRQAVLAGRTDGLRPAQRRRLETLCHQRHPPGAAADPFCLQRLGRECRELDLPLTLVVGNRGVPRLLWLGELTNARALLERLPGAQRRRPHSLRLLTCRGRAGRPSRLQPQPGEDVVGLDLDPAFWLLYGCEPGPGGEWPAALWLPAEGGERAWECLQEAPLNRICGLDPEHPDRSGGERRPRNNPAGSGGSAPAPDPVVLLTLSGSDRGEARRRLAELEGLVRSAGARPVGVVEQRRSGRGHEPFWGEGKLRETALLARRRKASLVVTDRELTPGQARRLEQVLDLPVCDRSELILDIFAQRAGSAAGRLQVELAQLRYRLPRLTGRGRSLSRQGGGIGTRGPGETQLEKDRRAIARRLQRLQREVERLGAHRARLRHRRSGLRRLALVGYTNAGKSSLLNALTGATGGEGVLAADRPFSTLDPTTRRIELGRPADRRVPEILLTDTVGFIRDLPPQLIEAFRSTIEEALEADALLIVVDLSDPAWPEQLATVRRLLDRLGSGVPRLVVGNQIDRCPAGELERARVLEPGIRFVSATAGLGLAGLRRQLAEWRPCQHLPLPDSPTMALQLGDTVPDFTQESQLGPINFYDFAGDSWVVLFSHPADYTPVCTTELGEVARLRPEWEKRNVKTIALSVDPVESHKGWIGDINETQKTAVDYPILADADQRVSDLYGMIHPNANNTLTVRSVFIIDPSKKLRLQITYPASTGRNFDEILRVIDSLQLTDHHQVATPVNWQDGDDCVVVPSIPTDEARTRFPKGVTEIKPYLRMTPQPNK